MVSKAKSGYMNLKGAKPDADCHKVEGRVSTQLGCCNLFEPRTAAVQSFRCGECEYVEVGKREYLYGGT